MNSKPRIVGFHGPMGSGKSAAIEILDMHSRYNVNLVKFAQPLYDIQEYIYNRIGLAYQRPETFVKDRKLLQWVGTEWGRDTISKTLWGDLWQATADRLLAQGDGLVVCDDVRFENEAERIRNLGGVVIKISTNKNLDRITTANGIQNHSSETPLPDNLVDLTIENNGSLEEYREKLLVAFYNLQLI